MRVTNQLFFQDLRHNGMNTRTDLYKTYEQLSNGQKIQHSFESSSIYTDTMRLDYEITTFEQIKDTTAKAQTFANNTDNAMKQFTDLLTRFKTKLIQAASSANSTTSMQALGNELRAIKSNIQYAANTSINGQYIFSGTDMRQKPIDNSGNYKGNNESILTVAGAGVSLPYNVPGRDLFIGRDQDYNKIVKTNVQLFNKIEGDNDKPIQESNTIREMVGDYGRDTVFYLRGKKPNGDTFTKSFAISSTSKVSDLLERIGKEYGNTANNKLVDVEMNKSGQIVIKDLEKGNGNLDFHLVGATDKTTGTGAGAALVDNPSSLSTNSDIQITSFIKSDYKNLANNATTTIDYDKVQFPKDGNQLTSSVSQVIKNGSEYATSKTKLSQVAGAKLDGKEFKLQGVDKNGAAYDITINFATSGSTFTVGSTSYDIRDKHGNATPADEVTYQQLTDIVSMATSNTLPANNNDTDYQQAIIDSRNKVEVTMNYKGQIEIVDKGSSKTQITTSLYDNSNPTGAFAGGGTDGSALTFSANNALIEDEPYVDVFKDLENIIKAVTSERQEADSTQGNPRNTGLQSALKKIDHIMDHFTKRHTKIGSLSNALKDANERATLLSVNVKTIQSEVIDTDYGESMLKMNQLSISYQAMLQAISKINSLSLVNYI